MAITVTNLQDGVTAEGRRYVEATLQFPASYVQGDSFTAQTVLGLKEIREAYTLIGTAESIRNHVAATAAQAGRQLLVELDTSAKRLAPVHRLYAAVSTEQAAASDQSAFRFRVRYVGV